MVLDPRFTGWHPVPLLRRELTHFEDLLEMVHVLDVAAVMPSKHIRLLAVDQCCHCFDPLRVSYCLQALVLRGLYNSENIAAFLSVTA
jgi:hypothetical protein